MITQKCKECIVESHDMTPPCIDDCFICCYYDEYNIKEYESGLS